MILKQTSSPIFHTCDFFRRGDREFNKQSSIYFVDSLLTSQMINAISRKHSFYMFAGQVATSGIGENAV